jgi:hypothetical protein
MPGRLIVDLSLIFERKFRALKEQVWLHLGKNIGTEVYIDVKDSDTITDIKAAIQNEVCIHPNYARIYCGGVLLQGGLQIREINKGVQVNPGFTLKFKATESVFLDQMHFFFDAIFVSGIALAFPLDSGPGRRSKRWKRPLSTPDDRTKLENPAKRRRISTKSPLSAHKRAALRSTR